MGEQQIPETDTELMLRHLGVTAVLATKIYFLERALGKRGETAESLYPSDEYLSRLEKELHILGVPPETAAKLVKQLRDLPPVADQT